MGLLKMQLKTGRTVQQSQMTHGIIVALLTFADVYLIKRPIFI
jgi:hypothetical protein